MLSSSSRSRVSRVSPVNAALLCAALLGAALFGAACKPSIGDKCVLSTDCSTQGDRLCDTSQPDGYCTEFNCAADSCPDHAVCVLFNSSVQGCGYDDRSGAYGSRVARAFCVAQCGNDSDCRGGYVCRSPRGAPWNGLILDATQTYLTCLVPPFVDADGGDASIMSPMSRGAPPVCSAVAPDAGTIGLTTQTTSEAGTLPPLVDLDAGLDAGPDAGPDGGPTDGGDGG